MFAHEGGIRTSVFSVAVHGIICVVDVVDAGRDAAFIKVEDKFVAIAHENLEKVIRRLTLLRNSHQLYVFRIGRKSVAIPANHLRPISVIPIQIL